MHHEGWNRDLGAMESSKLMFGVERVRAHGFFSRFLCDVMQISDRRRLEIDLELE